MGFEVTGVLEAGQILMVEHFGEMRKIPAITGGTTQPTVTFGGSNTVAFAGSGSNIEWSTLDSDGRLPQNKVGRLSGVMLRFYEVDLAPDEGDRLAAFRSAVDIINNCSVKVFVGNVVIASHFPNTLTSPPEWLQVGSGTAANGWALTQNGGWPVAFGEHPIVERQQLRVEVAALRPLANTLSADILQMCCVWQVKTATVFATR